MRLRLPPLQARCLQTGVSLLLASQCLFGALPGVAEPLALAGAPAAVEQLASTSQAAMPPAAAAPAPGSASQSALQGLMSLEQARQLSALQDTGSLPSDEKVALRKASVANSQLKDKGALKILKSGQDYAERGADPETQMLDPAVLRQAEGRFTLLIDELAPTFAGGYANRANVRVALKVSLALALSLAQSLALSPPARRPQGEPSTGPEPSPAPNLALAVFLTSSNPGPNPDPNQGLPRRRVRPLTTYYLLLTTDYLLLTTYYLLIRTTAAPRPTTYYLLLTTYYSRLTTHYSLLTTKDYRGAASDYLPLTTHY